jgi:small subunit ribosomal protein S7
MNRKESFVNQARTGLDPIYGNPHLFKFINRLMLQGKKSIAEKIVYSAFDIIKAETQIDPLEVFLDAIENIRPTIEVRSRRIGGATYQIPVDVRTVRSYSLAMRWFVEETRKRKEKEMVVRLAKELIDARNSTGGTFKRKENMMKTVESNRAFSHLKF